MSNINFEADIFMYRNIVMVAPLSRGRKVWFILKILFEKGLTLLYVSLDLQPTIK